MVGMIETMFQATTAAVLEALLNGGPVGSAIIGVVIDDLFRWILSLIS